MVDPSGSLELSAMEQRVLGSLLEKQRTVPATYPMTVNSVRVACNQTSSRDPVVSYDEPEIEQCLRDLRHRDLIRVVHADRGQRTLKFHQLLDERLTLASDERAVITVLLLRGPQTPGELKSRTDRLHRFADRDETEAVLHRLAGRTEPLVSELPRRPGQHENRWVHLLGPVEGLDATADLAPEVDRESVLAEGPAARDAAVATLWDAVAEPYTQRYGGPVDPDSFEAWLLTRVAALAGADPILDVGCGPGDITAFLADAVEDLGGVGGEGAVLGVDISSQMVAAARDRYPHLTFEVGDLRSVVKPRAAAAWGAVTAWHALIHLAPSELTAAVAALARVLRPGGWLALAMPAGTGLQQLDSWLGSQGSAVVVEHDLDEVRAAVQAAGLVVDHWYLRSPASDTEDRPRLYVLARTPG